MEICSTGIISRHNGQVSQWSLCFTDHVGGTMVREGGHDASGYLRKKDREVTAVIFKMRPFCQGGIVSILLYTTGRYNQRACLYIICQGQQILAVLAREDVIITASLICLIWGGSRGLPIFTFKLATHFPTLTNFGIQELIYYNVMKKSVLNRENGMWHYDKKCYYGCEGRNDLQSYSNPKLYHKLPKFCFLCACIPDRDCPNTMADIFQYVNSFDDMCMHS